MADSDDDDTVGYGNPPKHSRFPQGRSGKPSGRPSGALNGASASGRECFQLGRRKNPFGKNPSRVSRERSGTDQETECSVAVRPEVTLFALRRAGSARGIRAVSST